MRRFACLLLVMALAVALAAQTTKKTDQKPATGKTEAASPPAPETVNEFLRHTFGYDPNIKWQIARIRQSPAPGVVEVDVLLSNPQNQQITKLYITPDGKFAVVGDMVPFGPDPFAAARTVLETRAKGPAQGPADAALTIVEFGDLQCPSCKAAQPTIDKLMADLPNARLIFQPFPLPMHNWAMKAAQYGECVARQSNQAFFKFAKDVYQKQEQVTAGNADEQLKQAVSAAGLNGDQVAACAALPAIEARVKQSIELGNALDVTATPTIFLNGHMISNVNGLPYELLKTIAEYQATQK